MPAQGWEQCGVMWLGFPALVPWGLSPWGARCWGHKEEHRSGGSLGALHQPPPRALSFSTAVWQPPCSGQASTGTSRESQGVLAMMHKPSHIFLLPPKTREQKGTPPLPMDNRAGKED